MDSSADSTKGLDSTHQMDESDAISDSDPEYDYLSTPKQENFKHIDTSAEETSILAVCARNKNQILTSDSEEENLTKHPSSNEGSDSEEFLDADSNLELNKAASSTLKDRWSIRQSTAILSSDSDDIVESSLSSGRVKARSSSIHSAEKRGGGRVKSPIAPESSDSEQELHEINYESSGSGVKTYSEENTKRVVESPIAPSLSNSEEELNETSYGGSINSSSSGDEIDRFQATSRPLRELNAKLPENREVSHQAYQQQKVKVDNIRRDLARTQQAIKTINLDNLPDKGFSLRNRQQQLEKSLIDEVKALSKMEVDQTSETAQHVKFQTPTWKDIQAGASKVQPKTFGKTALNTYNTQKVMTMEKLHEFLDSLKTRPKENDLQENPKNLNVDLMDHQKKALAWLTWREQQKPSGGILADDMGLGKTLTMISLILKSKENEKAQKKDMHSKKYSGSSLIICPATLVDQWKNEVERRTKRGSLSVEVFHGPKRDTRAKKLASYDMVITTYAVVTKEHKKAPGSSIFGVEWDRIIVDEAHQIRNHKSLSSVAVCDLSARSRFALTGTPVHNKELDFYALLKFLRCAPFDDLSVWKRWVGDKSAGGMERLHTVISTLMLRRTKAELTVNPDSGGTFNLPARSHELITLTLNKQELDVYNRILIFSRTLFAQFLHQRAEKNTNLALTTAPDKPNVEYFKMRDHLLRLHKARDVQQHDILVLLLRLRQICCHPSLIIKMLRGDVEDNDDEIDEGREELDLLEQLNKLDLNEEHERSLTGDANDEKEGFQKEVAKLLNPKNPIFSQETISSKIKKLLEVLKETVVNKTGEKAVIVSQWPGFLKIIGDYLKKEGIQFDQLDGSIPVPKRSSIVSNFNDEKSKLKVLLLSLTAGGVGLNLVGGNHLFLLDLHWNPQLESQAQDRIYRVGQKKPVFIYKFITLNTIENRILDLQEKKLEIANSMLTGAQVNASKLTLQDLRTLFEM